MRSPYSFLILIATLAFSLIGISNVNSQTVSFDYKDSTIPCLNKKFTIVAHVFLDSLNQEPTLAEADITAMIDEVNEIFKPICASFEICEFNYIPYYQFDTLRDGIIRRDMEKRYFVRNHINMFFIHSQTLEVSPNGFASFNAIQEPDSGIVVIERNGLDNNHFFIARNLGTYFGLYDTNHEPGTELVDGSNCATAGDMICDTPADPYIPMSPFDTYIDFEGPPECLYILGQTDPNGEDYVPDVGNIMSWYAPCYCGFSKEQYIKMANNYLQSAKKKW